MGVDQVEIDPSGMSHCRIIWVSYYHPVMTFKRNNPAYPPDGTPCDVGHFCITNQDKEGNYI